MRYYQLYLITNDINNKKYVGQTLQSKGYKKRFKEHINTALKAKTHLSCLHKAIIKYGANNFSVKLLLHDIPQSHIDFYECLWIKKLNTYYGNNCGYNMTYGGNGVKGYHYTNDVKKRISMANKLYWENLSEKEYKAQCKIRSDNLKGKPKSEIHKKHLSETRIKKGVAKGCNNGFYGKQHTAKTKKLISESNSKAVGMYDIKTNTLIKQFTSIHTAVYWLLTNNKTKNVDAASRISKICNNKGKTAYGYIWKFL